MARKIVEKSKSSRNWCVFRAIVMTRNRHGHGHGHGHGVGHDSDYHQDRPHARPCLGQSKIDIAHLKESPETRTFLGQSNISTYFKDIVTMRNRWGSITWKKYSPDLDLGSKCLSYAYRISHERRISNIAHHWVYPNNFCFT